MARKPRSAIDKDQKPIQNPIKRRRQKAEWITRSGRRPNGDPPSGREITRVDRKTHQKIQTWFGVDRDGEKCDLGRRARDWRWMWVEGDGIEYGCDPSKQRTTNLG
ncbi:hypothetical protein Ddye_008319 [Dipteronia dyeriana]|uniref:Uncharacterized protein n=1 Tax=Dipteronia dyeriana TaxID=168575 RepID=A0AAD9X9K6_9ROSI|nr:hypothetical protein Ddye_008319 [Dipteronia dyeriana]